VKAVAALKNSITVKGMAHITGGGIPGNVPRMLPKGISAHIETDSWPVPCIFHFIKKTGKVPEDDMRRTFNMGIGYVIVVPKTRAEEAVSLLHASGYDAYIIGKTGKGGNDVRYA
jgi:phosphoribosylformylglycinamidine cyclo-ligase